MKTKIPRLSSPVAFLVAHLSGNRVSPWYLFTRVKRGRTVHRPAFQHREDGGRGGLMEVGAFDFQRALDIGVVEVAHERLGLGSRLDRLEDIAEGTRVKVRVVPLGRAALVVWQQRYEAQERAKNEKRQARNLVPLNRTQLSSSNFGKHVVTPPKVGGGK